MKRKHIIHAASITAILLGIILANQYVRKSVVIKDKKSNENGSWGYKIERYRFENRYRLTIWETSPEKEIYQAYEKTAYWGTPKVNDARWLSGDRAIYLDLRVGKDDSDPSFMVPDTIIFDFTSGQMTTCSGRGNVIGPGLPDEDECQRVLKRLGN